MSEESQNHFQDQSESAAMPALLQCPVEPTMFLTALHSSGLHILEEIEKHVSTSQCHHPPLKDLVLHGSLDGSTPLLLACYFGDFDCVKHIVENWHVDLQAPGVYYSSPLSCEKMGVATPLFVAAHNLHYEIVHYLIGKGADVNGKGTRLKDVEGPTPLHGVLSHSKSLETRAIVRAIALLLLKSGADPNIATHGTPIWMEESCGTVITTTLVEHGLKLDQRNRFGNTILHDRVQESWSFQFPQKCDRAMALIKLLVNYGADLMARDRQGFTPILLASVSGSWPVLDFMLERDEIVRKEKIDALEMAAATILSSNDWNSEQERAFEYLREALRRKETESFPMNRLKLKRGRTIGWTTSAELDQVIAEPTEYHLQSYLIQLRILSDNDKSHHQDPVAEASNLQQFLFDCIDYLKEQHRLGDIVDVLWATLETIQLHLLDSPHKDGLSSMANYVIENLIWVLSQLGRDDPLYNSDTFRSILEVLLVADRVHSRFCASRLFCCQPVGPTHMDILFQLVTFLAGLPEEMLNDETQRKLSIKNLLSRLVHQGSRSKRGHQSFLHMACDAESLDLATIQLLLQINADPNAADKDGNGPIHVLGSLRYGNSQEHLIRRTADAARLLLENGAHVDRVNKDRKTAAQVWKENNGSQDLPNWLLEPGMVPKLKCLSARIIRSNNIVYTAVTLPEILHPFVKWH